MTAEQVIELVEKWLEDPSRVTVEELETAADAAHTAYSAAAWGASACWVVEVAAAAYWAADDAYSAANAVDADFATWADAAYAVAKYHELTKG